MTRFRVSGDFYPVTDRKMDSRQSADVLLLSIYKDGVSFFWIYFIITALFFLLGLPIFFIQVSVFRCHFCKRLRKCLKFVFYVYYCMEVNAGIHVCLVLWEKLISVDICRNYNLSRMLLLSQFLCCFIGKEIIIAKPTHPWIENTYRYCKFLIILEEFISV